MIAFKKTSQLSRFLVFPVSNIYATFALLAIALISWLFLTRQVLASPLTYSLADKIQATHGPNTSVDITDDSITLDSDQGSSKPNQSVQTGQSDQPS